MTEFKKTSLVPGLVLIILGSILLINKLAPDFLNWYQIYPLIILGLGLIITFSALQKQDKGGVFPGTILFLVGIFFILRNYDVIPYYYVRDIWPVFIIFLGLGFLALFIVKPSDWGVLIPASLFIFFGTASLLRMYDIIDWSAWRLTSRYWPVILIIIGAGIILSSLKKRQQT